MVAEEYRVPTLDVVIKGSPIFWRATHKDDLIDWEMIQSNTIHMFVHSLVFECQDWKKIIFFSFLFFSQRFNLHNCSGLSILDSHKLLVDLHLGDVFFR